CRARLREAQARSRKSRCLGAARSVDTGGSRMNDPDNFLSRWSRRKQEAGESKEKNETGEAVAAPEAESQQGKPAAPNTAPNPESDVERLPPVETISADTDIIAFMGTGVPETLKH